MKFRKKPVEIEAEQLTWQNWCTVCDFIGDFKKAGVIGGVIGEDGVWYWGDDANAHIRDNAPIALKITTLEGDMIANENDWIIRGVKGELYPCKPDIFEATYEPVYSTGEFEDRMDDEQELRDKTEAQQKAKERTFAILKTHKLSIPPDLKEEFDSDEE